MPEHRATISGIQRWDDEAGAYVAGYRAVCSCGRRSAFHPLDGRALAEAWADQHESYHRRVARITGGGR